MESRRSFSKKIILGSAYFAFAPTINAVSKYLNIDNSELTKCFDDEFHYFDNNLTNLHFYFINAKIKKRKLKKSCVGAQKSFMIVKIPQQHISEQLLSRPEIQRKPDEINGSNEYLDDNKNTESVISGFSYLAFEIINDSIDVSNIETLICWDAEINFRLVIPKTVDYVEFPSGFASFKADKKWNRKEKEKELKEKQSIKEFYKDICLDLFKKNPADFPLTVLEIPQGLLISPYAPDQTVAIDGKDQTIHTRALFSKPPIKKQQFIYNNSKGEVIRSVQEIWNTQMWFQQFYHETDKNGDKLEIIFQDKVDPSLRPVAYYDTSGAPEFCLDENHQPIIGPDGRHVMNECPDSDIKYLPTFLDKQELTYIAGLGRKGTEGKEWNIETKGLGFSGLGAIAKLHYKNYAPPVDTDLAEYEHHITMGRDEYIKVARIGVISVTGQRALHVKIGERKIKDGVSYMEFREYIEIIQKELVYFDEKLFIPRDNQKEKYNYIQARKTPKNDGAIVHSYDDIYDGALNEDKTNDVWWDRLLWKKNLGCLPDSWNTHYRRWPFKSVASVTLVSEPICPPINILKPVDSCRCLEAFWPVLETMNERGVFECIKDCELDFIGTDWNDQKIPFSSTFLFIRKTVIEKATELTAETIYENFFGQEDVTRRQIRFVNKTIALTEDFTPKYKVDEHPEQENKSNIAKTDFIEYYFSLALEPSGETLIYDDIKRKIEPANVDVNISSVFNERFFPLFPQVKKAQLYIENIQSYAPEPTASIIEYNEDYINYGYSGLVRDVTGNIDKGKNETERVYNKARLIFNHSENFIKDKDKILDFKNNKWVPREAENGYKKIKEVFSGAGDVIGGMVNPDFDLQSIGLVKQSISVGRDINKKYEKIEEFTDKIDKFNPSDLLRQAPEIFNGISLIDILQEIFPDFEAPLNEIKNIGAKIDTIKNELLSNPVYLEIKADLKAANDKVKEFLDLIDSLQKEIDGIKNLLKSYKDKLNGDFLFSEIEKLVESAVAQYKIDFLEFKNGIANIADKKIESVIDYLTGELLSKTEAIYPYYVILNDALTTFKKVKDVSPGIKAIIEKYESDFIQANQYILIDLKAQTKETILTEYSEIKKLITANVKSYYNLYKVYSEAINLEAEALKVYTSAAAADLNSARDKYLIAKETMLDAKSKYQTAIETASKIKTGANALLTELKKHPDFQKISQYEKDIAAIQSNVFKLTELLDIINLPSYIDLYEKMQKDVNTFKSKLGDSKLGEQAVKDIINKVKNDFEGDIQLKRKALETHYSTEYDTYKKDLNQLVSKSKVVIDNYVKAIGIDRIDEILKIKSFSEGFTALKDNIKKNEAELEKKLTLFRDEVKRYEAFIKNPIGSLTTNIVVLIKQKLKEKEEELLKDPDNQDLIKAYAKAKELYNIISSLEKKETNYNWQTSSFKNADFGIVSFIASQNPKTNLSVNVKSTIYFQPNKFPAVVSRIEGSAENRLQNFGISLLKAIIINFNEVCFVAGTNQKPKFEVKIRDVQFAGAFSFVQALEGLFKKLLGDNFSVILSPQSVAIQYLLPIPYAGAPSFGFKDILFKIIYTLYFDKKPMELGVGIGAPENRTKLSVGIYTGLFYFIVIGNPKQGITTIEVSIEFGGYFGLNLGPLRGEVKLVVGLYYKKDLTGVVIEGYFLCEGRVKLWIFTITARFYMGVRSQGSYVEGRCTVSYEIRISRFFTKSFSATYYKKMAGATPGNNQSGSTFNAVEKYKLLQNKPFQSTDFAGNKSTLMSIANPAKRKVKPLREDEWEIFINSYID
jgi:hypothetical protein